MKDTSAKNVLAEFFEVGETSSGYIARCPACDVQFAVNVKRDVVVDDYVRLLLVHAAEERVTFNKDDEIRHWLKEDASGSFREALEEAAKRAGWREYRVLRPFLRQLREVVASDPRLESAPTGKKDSAAPRR